MLLPVFGSMMRKAVFLVQYFIGKRLVGGCRLVRTTPYRAAWPGPIVLCSWVRHLGLNQEHRLPLSEKGGPPG